MFYLTVVEMIQGFCAEYAIFPEIYTLVDFLRNISLRMAIKKLVFPDPISPMIITNFPFYIEVLISLRA